MPSQALAFGEFLAAGVLVTMGLTGKSVRDVFAGNAKKLEPIAPPAPLSGAGAGGQGVAFAGGSGGTTVPVSLPSGTQIPTTKRAARLLKGVGHFDGKPVALWIIPYLIYARSKGWKGSVESGYRSASEQRRICSETSGPCAAPGKSNHQGKAFPRGAVDVSEAPQLAAILEKIPGGLLKWAGAADTVHFSFPHGGGY